jgi:hypothetical protein
MGPYFAMDRLTSVLRVGGGAAIDLKCRKRSKWKQCVDSCSDTNCVNITVHAHVLCCEAYVT